MCFLKVKDGHLTILTDCPVPSFWPELSNCEEAKSMMVCVIIETFRKLNVRKRKLKSGMEPYTVTIVGTGKSIDFYIFVNVGYYPLLPLACTCILLYTVVVYCI